MTDTCCRHWPWRLADTESDSQMPIDYRVIVPAGIVHATFRGRISVSDIEAYRSRLRIDAEFSPEMDSLADFSEVSTLEPVGSEMATIVLDDPFIQNSRHAAAASNPAVFGMLRMYEMMANRAGSRSRVFRTLAEAQEWLGLTTGGIDLDP